MYAILEIKKSLEEALHEIKSRRENSNNEHFLCLKGAHWIQAFALRKSDIGFSAPKKCEWSSLRC